MIKCEMCLEFTDRIYNCQSKTLTSIGWLLCTACFLDLDTTSDITRFNVMEVS